MSGQCFSPYLAMNQAGIQGRGPSGAKRREQGPLDYELCRSKGKILDINALCAIRHDGQRESILAIS